MKEAGFDASVFERQGGTAVHFDAGQTIFSEGDTGKVMFFIRDGEVSLSLEGQALSTVFAGEIFGEMAMIDGSARSATAVAASSVSAVAIDRTAFLAVVRDAPEFAMHVLTVLSIRVRELSCLI